jgi:hypothetical protein
MIGVLLIIFLFGVVTFPIFKTGSDEDDRMGW